MRNRFFQLICFFAAVLVLFTACEKNELNTTEVNKLTANEAQVKVMFASFYRSNPRIYIKVNDQIVSSTLTTFTPFPGGGLNTGGGSTADYLRVTAGQNSFAVAVPKFGTNVDSLQLANVQQTVAAGKKYSLYFADTSANTTSLLVEDSLTAPDSGFVIFKFVNMMPDVPTGLDLYIGSVKVASAIPYKGVSPSFVLPTNNASSTWAIRVAGGTTNLVTYANASSLSNQRVFTVLARGYNAITSTSTAEPRRRLVSLIYNQ
ncbi:uncharacterized protein DUF4397 [Lacibacter cauensis]|uniref:Uncharacterized protein DUF4397 n=1 Tax=Lacibacter cauensis TaxID=510947 RepID=A0A562SY93_9BACT|nr:DUF4397 domain-containing protein [Lacibacter cauensis]TWI85696.1 uncharacterized protein DUF4397 [Lacibacter cauensis]